MIGTKGATADSCFSLDVIGRDAANNDGIIA